MWDSLKELVIDRWGVPVSVLLDNDKRYEAGFKRGCVENGIERVFSVPNTDVHNPVAERAIRLLRADLDKSSYRDINMLLPAILLHLNGMPRRGLGWRTPQAVMASPQSELEQLRLRLVQDREKEHRQRVALPDGGMVMVKPRTRKLRARGMKGPHQSAPCQTHGVNCRLVLVDDSHVWQHCHVRRLKECAQVAGVVVVDGESTLSTGPLAPPVPHVYPDAGGFVSGDDSVSSGDGGPPVLISSSDEDSDAGGEGDSVLSEGGGPPSLVGCSDGESDEDGEGGLPALVSSDDEDSGVGGGGGASPVVQACSPAPTDNGVFYGGEEALKYWSSVSASEVSSDKIPTTREEVDVPLHEGATPVYRRPYPTPFHLREEEGALLKSLEESGKIRRVGPGEWNSPFFVKKEVRADGSSKLRPLMDFSALNTRVKDRRCPLPNLQSVLNDVAKAEVFTVVDLTSGFHQVRVTVGSGEVLAFTAGV
jgi:hypothetical protein